MCKTCGPVAYIVSVTGSINYVLYTMVYGIFYRLRITARYAQLYTYSKCLFMNIKISLTVSVKNHLYTVSTYPITKTITLNFNEIIIILRTRSITT